MADRVEALPLLGEARRLELGVEDALLAVQRPREIGAVWPEDRAAATAEHVHPGDLVGEREVGGIRPGPLEVGGSDHECA